jgi:predicted acylesterase/phospholipase RssA
MYDTLILSGGGLLILSIAACLERLDSQLNFKTIKSYHGTSTGSIMSFLLCIGMSPSSIVKILGSFNFEKIMHIQPENIIDLMEKTGILSTKNITEKLKLVCLSKYNKEDITFAELYEETGKELNIYTTNFTKQKCRIFNHNNSPDVSVLLAIEMSCCVPIIFEQIEFEGDIYVDGGLCAHFPTPKTLTEGSKVFGIMISPIRQELMCQPGDPLWFIYSIYLSFSIYLRYSTKLIKRFSPYDIIIIESQLDIYLNDEKKEEMRMKGLRAAEEFLNKRYISKDSETESPKPPPELIQNDIVD